MARRATKPAPMATPLAAAPAVTEAWVDDVAVVLVAVVEQVTLTVS